MLYRKVFVYPESKAMAQKVGKFNQKDTSTPENYHKKNQKNKKTDKDQPVTPAIGIAFNINNRWLEWFEREFFHFFCLESFQTFRV